jgi:pectin methylesterase-like acyl-CoA thioesterase
VDYSPVIFVGTDKEYKTVNEALSAIVQMDRSATERVTVMIDPGNYEEMLVVKSPNVTLKNAAATPDIALAKKGVDISPNAVRITSYYGHGYSYYSMGNNQKWNAEILRVNKENGYLSYSNAGAGTTKGSYWNAGVVISANGFEAEDIIFENSFNQYISKKESEDVVVMWEVGNKGLRPTDIGNASVQNRSFVERAAAIAITNNTDKVVLTNCRVVGRQDAFYGGAGTRVVVKKGAVMGAVDYIFGGMTAVFYKTDLVMNTSDESVDAAYLTAAQQTTGRGYLMYKCTVKSAIPGTETASSFLAKPGYFGRPWQATTSEVVFYNTTVSMSDFTGSEGKSLISPAGWTNSLGAESNLMYEYGTFEFSGEDNSSSRVAWSTVLTSPTLADGTEITTFNFTKGIDNWDPLPIEQDEFAVSTNTLTIASPGNSTNTFDITANVSWKVSSDQSWLSVSTEYGKDDATITLTATGNGTLAERTATVTVSGNGVASQTITVTQDAGVTGINEKNEKPFKVFPNPATSILTLNNFNKGAVISIYDVNGNLLINETAKAKIDVSHLAKGVYSMRITDSKSIKMIKFIKQ